MRWVRIGNKRNKFRWRFTQLFTDEDEFTRGGAKSEMCSPYWWPTAICRAGASEECELCHWIANYQAQSHLKLFFVQATIAELTYKINQISTVFGQPVGTVGAMSNHQVGQKKTNEATISVSVHKTVAPLQPAAPAPTADTPGESIAKKVTEITAMTTNTSGTKRRRTVAKRPLVNHYTSDFNTDTDDNDNGPDWKPPQPKLVCFDIWNSLPSGFVCNYVFYFLFAFYRWRRIGSAMEMPTLHVFAPRPRKLKIFSINWKLQATNWQYSAQIYIYIYILIVHNSFNTSSAQVS